MSFVAGMGRVNIDLIYGGLGRIPGEGEEVYSSDFSVKLGGGTPATLVALARLGVPVRLATYLGDDLFSGFAAAQLASEGVEPLNLHRGGDFAVNVSCSLLTPGDRTFVTYGERAEPDAVASEAFCEMSRGAKVALMHKGSPEIYRALKKEGAILVLDTGWEDGMKLEGLKEYLRLADYFTPNKKEALQLTGASCVEEAGEILSEYLDKVIIKLDNRGCFAMEGKERFYIEQIDAFENIDCIGAGDAFLAGLIYGIYKDMSFRDSIICGNVSGGKCVTASGCLTARLGEDELLSVLADIKRRL